MDRCSYIDVYIDVSRHHNINFNEGQDVVSIHM